MDGKERRELEARLAVELFGWRWYASPPNEYRGEMAGLWPPDSGGYILTNFHEDSRLLGKDPGDVERFADWDQLGYHPSTGYGVPCYLSSASHALLVADKLKGPPPEGGPFTWGFELAWVEDGEGRTGWVASFGHVESPFCETAPEAIGLAALALLEQREVEGE